MLDLNARVDLDKVNPVQLRVHQKFDGAHVVVAHGPADAQRVLVEQMPLMVGQIQGRRHLHHLLKPPLHRAVALVEVHQVAVLVAHELHLNVLGALDELLQKHGIVAEGIERLVARLEEALFQLLIVADDAHSPTPPAAGGLQHHGVADALGLTTGGFKVVQLGLAALNLGHLALLGHFLGPDLIAERFHHVRIGTHEDDAFLAAAARERSILAQEAVAGVDGVGAVFLGHAQQPFDVQIRLERLIVAANLVGFVGLVAVQRVAVLVGVHGHRGDAQLGGGAQHADGNFAPVGDEQLADVHGESGG